MRSTLGVDDAYIVGMRGRFAIVVGTNALILDGPARIAQTKTVAVVDNERIVMMLYCWIKVSVRVLLNVVYIFEEFFYDFNENILSQLVM